MRAFAAQRVHIHNANFIWLYLVGVCNPHHNLNMHPMHALRPPCMVPDSVHVSNRFIYAVYNVRPRGYMLQHAILLVIVIAYTTYS